jgi:hypothetical protein
MHGSKCGQPSPRQRRQALSEARFTPGPWEAVQIEEGLFHIHSPKGERRNPVPVAVVDHHRDGYTPIRTVTAPADANLIAAAPAMYEALKDVEWSDSGYCPQCTAPKHGNRHQLQCILGNALLAAEGKR